MKEIKVKIVNSSKFGNFSEGEKGRVVGFVCVPRQNLEEDDDFLPDCGVYAIVQIGNKLVRTYLKNLKVLK